LTCWRTEFGKGCLRTTIYKEASQYCSINWQAFKYGKEEALPPMPSAKLRTLHWDKVNALPNEPMVWNDLSKLLECVFKVLSFLVIILWVMA
jgi:hypothetical protein